VIVTSSVTRPRAATTWCVPGVGTQRAAGTPSIVQRSVGSAGEAVRSGRCDVDGRYGSRMKCAPFAGDVIASAAVGPATVRAGGSGLP